jgi:hypothetical protein
VYAADPRFAWVDRRAVRDVLTAALGAWLVALVVISAIRVGGDHNPPISGFASTPDLIADGHLWTLLTSAMPVGRWPFAEIAGIVAAIYGVWRVAGIGAVWVAGLAAHIGSALLVYAGIGVLWLVDHASVSDQVDRLDYGISAIWLGELGFLTAALRRRNRRLAAGVGVASLAVSLGLLPVAGEMATAEHLLAFAIGAVLPMTVMT